MRLRASILLLISLSLPSAASAAAGTGGGGGARYGDRELKLELRRAEAPLFTRFAVNRRKMYAYGAAARIEYKVRAPGRRVVRLRLQVIPAGARRPVRSFDLGRHRANRTGRYVFRGGGVGSGRFVLRLTGRDERGRRIRRGSRSAQAAPLAIFGHRFPVAGAYDLGGEGARFGAGRPGHVHQGQDITGAEGIPVVAPRGGVVTRAAYQPDGAGYYVILAGSGERLQYAFMHMQRGSIAVREGQRVLTGQTLGRLGNTGASSGPHLHFEIWDGPWQTGGRALDPLPYLRRWGSWS